MLGKLKAKPVGLGFDFPALLLADPPPGTAEYTSSQAPPCVGVSDGDSVARSPPPVLTGSIPSLGRRNDFGNAAQPGGLGGFCQNQTPFTFLKPSPLGWALKRFTSGELPVPQEVAPREQGHRKSSRKRPEGR